MKKLNVKKFDIKNFKFDKLKKKFVSKTKKKNKKDFSLNEFKISLEKIKSVSRYRLIFLIGCLLILVGNLSAYFLTYGEFVSRFDENSDGSITGISNDTVIIDDLKTDYDYYMGLNYTAAADGRLPSGEDQELYSDSNLVQAKIIYNGTDINSGHRGYVSDTEMQYVYIYYKTFAVNNNGTSSTSDDYIDIELIDNPFTYRPDGKAFNGWVTTYDGAVVSLDTDIYVRNAKVPVTYTSGVPDAINITLNASWIDATWTTVSSSRTWATAFGELDAAGMKEVVMVEHIVEYAPLYMDGYFYQVTIARYESYAGYYNDRGVLQTRGTCNRRAGCPYYQLIGHELYDPEANYYELTGGRMVAVDHDDIELEVIRDEYVPNQDIGDGTVAGYFKSVSISRGASLVGYYNNLGVLQTSGTCGSTTCTYYELIQYRDEDGNINKVDPDDTYYYLVTRDTNIVVMTSDMSTTWASAQSKPFTLTSFYGDDYRNSVVWNVATYTDSWWGGGSFDGVVVNAYADMTIENIAISCGSEFDSTSNAASGTNTEGAFYGRFFNVKLGRGIVRGDGNSTFVSVLGGSNGASGSSGSVTEYRLMIESGFYNSLSIGNGVSNSSTVYMEADAIYGNDYDRALENNSRLDIYYCASGSWGGNYYSSSNIGISFDLTVKSGSFGSSKYDHTTGIYVGARYGGTHYTARRGKILGGYIYNLIGGPITANNRGDLNDTYMYIMGGTIDMVTGGAGTSATYGNRIVQVTGGTVNYSVFGGSNGYDGGNGDGTLNGSSFVYIGGDAEIGSDTNVNNGNTLFGAEAGSVFGIGNGNDDYASIGSNKNSNIIIDKDATIKGNVYGGGNYAAVGVSSNASTTSTYIKILGGEIRGSVYGGGNRNGSGSTNITASIKIEMYGGEVKNSIYGGSNELGFIYGTVDVLMVGGTTNNVFGGGRGGWVSNNQQGTFVARTVNVTIGSSTSSLVPVVTGEVFGGSAYGTVNGTTNNDNVSSYNTSVVVNKGTIGSVFGGGKGDNSFTPYVLGNVTVTVNGGDITNVFGGNDAAGTPNGTVTVYLKGGNVTNAYGGGNMTSVRTTNVYLQGATCGKIFGGSNQTGNVTTSNVTATSGTSTALYGGNNQGGVTTTSNVLINGATIGTVYGGGSVATTGTTNVTMNSGKVDNIYGGGESADVNVNANVTVNAGTIQNVYGGSNQAGDVPESNIEINSGKITNVFGGNNAGGTTSDTYIDLLGGTCKSVYGGGNNASCDTSNIVLDGSNVSNLFGGGNSAGLTTSNINLKSGAATRVFGGSNQTGNVTTSNIITSESEKTQSAQNPDIDVDVTSTGRVNTGGDYTSVIDLNVTVTNNSDETINNWTVNLLDEDSILHTNDSIHEISVSDGVYTFNQTTTQNVSADSEEKKVISIAPGASYTVSFSIYSNKIVEGYKPDNLTVIGVASDGNSIVQNDSNLLVSNLYGGNNKGGQTDTTNINLNSGYTHNIYGGGNLAPVNTTNVDLQNIVVGGQLYGGGNQAAVYNDTNLNLSGVSVTGSVFGGGNAGIVGNDTNVYINSSNILESVYAGGNGASAIVNKDAKLTIDGVTVVKKHVFGGGNAAATGTEISNNSVSLVNIAGANIGGNVYGGANTSVVYGNTKLFIGYDSIENNTNLVKGDIYIGGTVFGGGEANASGSANYDFSFISVTVGIDIKIDGNGHDNFDIDGSIFGSGNASSTTGYSYIDIDNYGTLSDIKRNISIQRANKVKISNSYIALKGAADRTNEFDDEPFTISRVDELKLKNNSSLYLEKGANLLKHYISAVDIGGNEVLGTVIIDHETKDVVKNVDNRIYIVGSTTAVLNIATNENVTAFGEVDGMTFFGLYEYTREGDIEAAMYKPAYGYGDSATTNDLYYFSDGSYVLGMHESNHDITVDGFYSNYENEEVEGEIQVKYIEPTPEDSNYYMWTIGEMTQSYVIDNLQASKYLTLGTEELPLIYHSDPNTVFSVVGFNYNLLNPEVNLLEEHEVPRIAANSTDADNNMSLVMETTDVGWTTSGSTVFLSNTDTPFKGTVDYRSENSTVNPTFQFYLYHSKNLGTNGSMGQVTISLLAVTPIDALTNEVERINIVIDLSRRLFNTNDYEASITTGKQYDLFASRDVNITTTGSFSAYYSLFVGEDADTFYKDGYYRALVTDYVLPAKTKITMIDYLDHDDPEYYYYNVSESDYRDALQEFSTNNEVSYEFSRFIKMGSNSSGNNYDDAEANSSYYDSDLNIINEEFIFIIDFSESNITTNVLDKGFLIELRDSAHQTRVSVLGAAQSLMKYNLHYNQGAVVDVKGTLGKTNIYPGDVVDLTVETDFIQKTSGGKTIYDTSYFDKQLGIKISILDASGNVVNGASLLGVTYTLDGVDYYPRTDGTVRLNIADRISNVASRIKLNTTDSLAPGDYTMKIESFGSPDGIYYGLESSDSVEIDFVVLDTVYGLSVSLNEKLVIIDSETGHTLNKNNALVFGYKYNSSLSNPNIRISLYRRDYSSVYSTNYNLVDLQDYITNTYNPTDKEFEYMLSTNPSDNTSVYMYLKDDLVTGTYRFTFALYDGNSYIGEVYQNVIIK